MAYSTFYADGTVTVSSGGTAVTGTGTAWVTAGVLPGSLLFIVGQSRPLPVRSVTAEGALILDMPAPDASTGAAYILLKLAYDGALTDVLSRLLSQQTQAFDLDGPDQSVTLVTDTGSAWSVFGTSSTDRWRIGVATGDHDTLRIQRWTGSAWVDALMLDQTSSDVLTVISDAVSAAAAEAASASAAADAASAAAEAIVTVVPVVDGYGAPINGTSDCAASWASALADNAAVVVPTRANALTSNLIVPAGKMLTLAAGATITYSGLGGLTFGDNASFVSQAPGAAPWVSARNLSGTIAAGPAAHGFGYAGAAYDYWLYDSADVGSDFVRGLNVHHVFGGSSARGGRAAVIGQIYHQGGATAADNPQRYYAAVIGDVHAQSTDGGSDTTLAGARGTYFGLAGHVYSDVVGGKHEGLVGCELNVSNKTGSTQAYVATLTLANSQGGRGAVADAYLMMSGLDNVAAGYASHVGNKYGILFTNLNGKDPFAADSTLVGWHWTGGGARTIETGIDLAGFAVTGNLLQGQKLAITESTITLGDNGSSEGRLDVANAAPSSCSLRLKSKGSAGNVIIDTASRLELASGPAVGTTSAAATRYYPIIINGAAYNILMTTG